MSDGRWRAWNRSSGAESRSRRCDFAREAIGVLIGADGTSVAPGAAVRFRALLLGASLLLLSSACGMKRPQFEVSATELSNRLLGAGPQQSAAPVAGVREAVRPLRQRLNEEKSRDRAASAPAQPSVTGTSGSTASAPQATGTAGTTDGSRPSIATSPAPVATPHPAADAAPGRQSRRRGVWLPLGLVTLSVVTGALLLTRRRSPD